MGVLECGLKYGASFSPNSWCLATSNMRSAAKLHEVTAPWLSSVRMASIAPVTTAWASALASASFRLRLDARLISDSAIENSNSTIAIAV